VMAVVTAAITVERLAPADERVARHRSRCRRGGLLLNARAVDDGRKRAIPKFPVDAEFPHDKLALQPSLFRSSHLT